MKPIGFNLLDARYTLAEQEGFCILRARRGARAGAGAKHPWGCGRARTRNASRREREDPPLDIICAKFRRAPNPGPTRRAPTKMGQTLAAARPGLGEINRAEPNHLTFISL
jgi:hypothetical protein